MTDPLVARTPQQRRNELRTHAEKMITHLRGEVLPVPGRRAAVRAALGHPPGSPRTFGAFREISDFLPAAPSRRQEQAFFAVAAMLCAQSSSNRRQEITADRTEESAPETATREQRSLGGSCAWAVNVGRIAQKSMESRLHQLCRVDATGAHRQLPRLVHHLRGIGATIDWVELIDDLAAWDLARDHIAARWLRGFYRGLTARSATPNRASDDASQEDFS